MLDLRQYASLGAALKDALERWPNETCLIEADRDREKVRLTYSDFKEMAQPLCRALEDADFKAGDRAAIIMTNQSKWLISAYSIFFCGGVLVPLDYKLTAAEHLPLLAHSKGRWERTCAAPTVGRSSGARASRGSWRGNGKTRPASCIRRGRAGVRKDACSRTTPIWSSVHR